MRIVKLFKFYYTKSDGERKFFMFESLNKELRNAKEKLHRKQKLEGLITYTSEALQKELNRKSEIEDILKDEDKDVKKLESLSITSIFYYILGSKEKQLEKERQELLAARLKYEECAKSVLDLEKELASYKVSLNDLIGVDEEYETALKRKEEFILGLENSNSQRLRRLMDKLSGLGSEKKEVQEAISAGDRVQTKLGKVIECLESAEGWGTWDMLGGGLIATSVKHSSIDEARRYAHGAKIALMRFENELSDVNIKVDIDINISSFETFIDYFFDNLISDWVVQSKINESLDNVNDVRSRVEGIMNSLKEKLNTTEKELTVTEEDIKSVIEKA